MTMVTCMPSPGDASPGLGILNEHQHHISGVFEPHDGRIVDGGAEDSEALCRETGVSPDGNLVRQDAVHERILTPHGETPWKNLPDQ